MILGITGTNGAGKGTVVEYLVEKHGFAHYSAREFLITEVQRRDLAVDRSNIRDVANSLRKEHGPAYVIETLFAQASDVGGDAVIESIRTLGECDFLRSVGAKMLAVDAEKKIRYERVVERGSETDHVSFEVFVEQEDREMSSTEPWDMNVFGVIERSDVRLDNSTTREALFEQIEKALTTLK